jgi:hypothetical protein
MISDAIGGMVDASQIEETGHTQAELSPQDRAFASRNQATYDAAEEMASRIRRGYERPPIHPADALDYPGDDMNVEGPNYDEPDPFDRSNPEEARQAKAIEDMNETLGE